MAAQTATDSAPGGALSITADEVWHHIGLIAHDSMEGRNTPSPGLEKTAQYVANQFQALGLKPAGDMRSAWTTMRGFPGNSDTSWVQRYRVPGTLRALPYSAITFTARLLHAGAPVLHEWGQPVDQTMQARFDATARFAADTIPEGSGMMLSAVPVQTRMRVLTGRHTPESLRRAGLDHDVVLYVPPAGLDSATERRIVRAITATSDVALLADEDSATFAARRAQAFEHPPVIVDKALEHSVPSHWAAYVWPGAVSDFLRTARLDLAQLRADTTPRVREVPSVEVRLIVVAGPSDGPTGMNVAAVLPGTDSLLLNQPIVISAHMDHTGVAAGSPARIQRGANDNASGVAGLLALAKAFSQPSARPKRPLLFVATSGGAKDKGQWGADAFAESIGEHSDVLYPLNVTLDMIGRVPGDSLLVNGLTDFDFATRPDWLAGQHPELGLKLVDGGTALTAASDHLAFLRRAVPSLYFHTADHGDAQPALDALDRVDAEQEVRVLRMLYYVIQDLANSRHLPHWTPASRERRAHLFGR